MTTQQDIDDIKARNKRVEADKAWEVSLTRKSFITIFTYITIVIFLHIIGAANPWLGAIVPAIGFYLSTLTLPIAKRLWLQKVYKR